jgi:CBS-domain-containing membrane protein
VLARDIMTTDVVTVRADATVRDVARLLAAKGISAVPVVDATGAPLGMVSEGDLISRNTNERDARRDWWLAMLAGDGAQAPGPPDASSAAAATAAGIMSAPVITVEESTNIADIARLLETYRIKRVPVVRDGKIVGIVSRADLIRTLAASAPPADGETASPAYGLRAVIAALDQRFHGSEQAASSHVVAPATPINTAISAQRFRELSEQYRHRVAEHRDQQREAMASHLQTELKELTAHHIDDQAWQSTLAKAAEAAEHGAKEYLLLRFPGALCSDGGRAINAPLPDWPRTLRGEAAEIYLRWDHELRARGFHLTARVLEFPGGFPGDIGLFLSWNG